MECPGLKDCTTKQKASYKTLWIDPRKLPQCLVGGSLAVGMMAWALVSVAVAQSIPETPGGTVKIADLLRFQWWAITGLLGLVGILISFFIIRELNNQKDNARQLWIQKLSKEEHREMDHSGLCAFCRTKPAK